MSIDNPYIIECDFKVDDLIAPIKEDIIAKYQRDVIDNPDYVGYNTKLENKKFDRYVGEFFVRKIADYFSINKKKVVVKGGLAGVTVSSDEVRIIESWIYCQNDKHAVSEWHSHIQTSTINAVFYYDVPKSGGELELDILGEKIIIKPEINKLYMFPGWVMHRTLPQKDSKWRICINLEYCDRERPMRKQTGLLW